MEDPLHLICVCIYTIRRCRLVEVAGTPDTETYAEILATCACLQLRKTNRVVTQLYDEALRPIGLRSTQLPILVTLAAHGALSLTDLADRLVLDRTTLIRNLRPLQRRGLIEVGREEGKRTHGAALTPAGHEAAAAAVPLWAKAQTRVMNELGTSESRDLHRSLSRLVSLLG